MVNALVKINDNVNRILNLIKVKYGLKDKSDAIAFVVNNYVDNENEPELRPEFVEKMRKIQKQKSIKVNNFAERYGLVKYNVFFEFVLFVGSKMMAVKAKSDKIA